MKRIKTHIPTLLFWTACLIVIVGTLVGCASLKEGQWFAQEQDLAAKIEEGKADLAAMIAKAKAADAAAKASPDNDALLKKYEDAMNAADAEARALAKEIIELESLIEQRKAAQKAEAEAREAAVGLLDRFAPEPYRSSVVAIVSLLFGFMRSRGYYTARENRSEAVALSVIRSVDDVLTADQKKTIVQGEKSMALVNKAQGKL